MAKYTTYKANNKVIVVSRFAGKPVRGVSKCDPKDTFDEKFGENLAKARCDKKVAEKRLARALELHRESLMMLERARARVEKMCSYVDDSYKDFKDAEAQVKSLEKEAGM